MKFGRIPIFEPDLEELVSASVGAGRSKFTTDLANAFRRPMLFLSRGNAQCRGDGRADLSFVFAAVEEFAKTVKIYTALVTNLTVPVGTSRKLEKVIR